MASVNLPGTSAELGRGKRNVYLVRSFDILSGFLFVICSPSSKCPGFRFRISRKRTFLRSIRPAGWLALSSAKSDCLSVCLSVSSFETWLCVLSTKDNSWLHKSSSYITWSFDLHSHNSQHKSWANWFEHASFLWLQIIDEKIKQNKKEKKGF